MMVENIVHVTLKKGLPVQNIFKFFRVITLMLMTMMALAGCFGRVQSQDYTPASDFSYELNTDGRGIIITGYKGNGGEVVIPPTIDDMPVLEIGKEAFMGGHSVHTSFDDITSIIVPDSVEVIGEYAFARMLGLTKATLPNGLKIIPSFAFSSCRKLVTVNLPTSLEAIHERAFMSCWELSELIIPATLTGINFLEWQWHISGFIENPNNDAFVVTNLPLSIQQRLQELGYQGQF